MPTRTRDTLALYLLAAGSILAVLYADSGIGQIWAFLLARV
jgi:hypothetical protein